MSIKETLSERGSRYGAFSTHAQITQEIKTTMRNADNWEQLNPSQKEALEMIAHKIGRIINGDPNYADSWHDIAGYATLVERELTNFCFDNDGILRNADGTRSIFDDVDD